MENTVAIAECRKKVLEIYHFGWFRPWDIENISSTICTILYIRCKYEWEKLGFSVVISIQYE